MFGGAIDPAFIQNGSEQDIEARIKYVTDFTRNEPGYFFSSAAINGTVDPQRAQFLYDCFRRHTGIYTSANRWRPMRAWISGRPLLRLNLQWNPSQR